MHTEAERERRRERYKRDHNAEIMRRHHQAVVAARELADESNRQLLLWWVLTGELPTLEAVSC